MKTELKKLILEVEKEARQAGKFLAGEWGKVKSEQIEEKGLHSLVSYADRTAEEMLVNGLATLVPGSVFITEEETVAPVPGEWTWVIDPLDGTTNFLHKLPLFSVSIALLHHGVPVLGVVLDVMRDECYSAWEGGGAWCNGERIWVSETRRLNDSLLVTGYPYYNFERLDAYLSVMKQLMQETRGLRRLGSAALDLAWVACGRFDAFFEYSLAPWDIAGGVVLVREAGGLVTDFSGESKALYAEEVLAVTPGLKGDMVGVLRRLISPGG